jgi:SAM-dependent methyltransferase
VSVRRAAEGARSIASGYGSELQIGAAIVAPLMPGPADPTRRAATLRRRQLTDGPALSPAAWLRFDVIRPELEQCDPARVLEIGPGRGAIAARLVAAGHDYTGVELSEPSRRATAELLSTSAGSARVVGGLDEVPADERFDLLCAFEVLEHVEDDVAALRDWVGRLRPGAAVLASVPAWPERFSITDEQVGHLRRYSPAQLQQLASEAGLVDARVVLYGFPLGGLLERVRDVMTRRERRRPAPPGDTAIERTKRSGAWHQPPRWANGAVRAGTWPFRRFQRAVRDRGTGLVLCAAVPSP